MSKGLKVLLLCIVVLVVIVLFVQLGDGESPLSAVPLPEALVDPNYIKTSDVVNGKFYSKSANCSWIQDGELSWVSRSGDLVRFSVDSGEKRVVVKADQFVGRPWKIKFSPDGNRVLIGFEPRRLFRSTILARYAVHDSSSGDLIAQLRVSPKDDESEEPYQSFQSAVWSNDNRTILVTYKNDLYAIQFVKGSSGITRVKRLTADGSDTVTNGVADWVYEEEIFTKSSTTIYPSPTQGSSVAYIKFNDSEVTPATYSLYGDYSQNPYFDEYFQYSKFGTVRYPKSGTRNPKVSVHVFRLSDDYCWENEHAVACSWDMNLNGMMARLLGRPPQHERFVLGALKWVNDGVFALQVLNRVQNSTWLLTCDVTARSCSVVRRWDQVRGWIDVTEIVVTAGNLFTLMSVGSDDGKEYNHVASVGHDRVSFVTRGTWSVDEIVGVFNGALVVKSPLLKVTPTTASVEDATQQHYYWVNVSNPLSPPKCLTCYADCTFNTAKFTDTYFVNTCERESTVSHVDVLKLAPDGSSTLLLKLEENTHLQNLLSKLTLPVVEYFSYDYSVGSSKYKLNCKVVGMPGWKKKPGVATIVDVYGGPNSQKVTRKFSPNDWSYALTSSHNVVYLVVDGVGSGRQSNSLSFEVYRDLGNKEIHDKVWVLKRFLTEHPNLDASKTLIWGWSYGGYLSAMVMGKDTDHVVRCGISVAPVVNWNYYDTIYTERYMSTPKDNPEGYNSSNVLQYLDNFHGKQYLLVHGNADDNVHYQQSMVLARGLEQKGVLFRMQSYPDENHSLGGVRPHLFATLEDFVINQCFQH